MSPCVFNFHYMSAKLCIAFTSRFTICYYNNSHSRYSFLCLLIRSRTVDAINRLSGIHYVQRLTTLSHSSLVGLIGWGWWRVYVCVWVHCTIACLGLVRWSGSLDSRNSSWESTSCGSNYKVTLTCELCPRRQTAYVCVTVYWHSITTQEVSLCIVNLTFGLM